MRVIYVDEESLGDPNDPDTVTVFYIETPKSRLASDDAELEYAECIEKRNGDLNLEESKALAAYFGEMVERNEMLRTGWEISRLPETAERS